MFVTSFGILLNSDISMGYCKRVSDAVMHISKQAGP